MRPLLVLVPSLVLGCQPWSRTDVGREAAFGVVMAIDMVQTFQITADCNELNPIIGSCGDRVPPEVYFPVTMLLHVLVVAVLPSEPRSAFQYLSIGAEGNMVIANMLRGR